MRASPAASWLEVDADRAGRIQVAPDLSVTRRNGAYPIGDTVEDEKSPPGLGQVAGTALSENLKHGTAFLPSGFIIAATQRLVGATPPSSKRVAVSVQWLGRYLTFQRGARLVD